MRIGIPRGLLYYEYFPLWKCFFEELSAEVIVSGPTTKRILDRGVQTAVDEACLPVKVFYGHAAELGDCVDFLFVPRVVSVEPRAYTCPKFLGLPDMLRASMVLPRLLSPTVNMRRNRRQLLAAVRQVAAELGAGPVKTWRAWRRAVAAYRRFKEFLRQGYGFEDAVSLALGQNRHLARQAPPARDLTVAVLGHPYLVYDQLVGMNLIQRLRSEGVRVLTADSFTPAEIEAKVRNLPKALFWTYEKQVLGAALACLDRNVDGIIQYVSFGCGPDSMIGELIQRWVRRKRDIPFTLLTVDEHTGQAGILTRVEAFLDMVARKKARSA